MGGKSKPQVTQTTQNNDPWAPAQPHLNNILSNADRLYGSGVGSQVYAGPRVAGFGDTTRTAMNGLLADAASGPSQSVTSGINFTNGLLGSGGMSAGEKAALGSMKAINTADLSGLRNILAGYGQGNMVDQIASDPSSVEKNLEAVARGDYLGGANPYMDALINQSAQDAANSVAGRFSSSGRYGSGAFSKAIADATGRIATQTRFDDYNNERGRQAQAAQAIDSARLARAGLAQSQKAQQIGATQSLIDNENQAANFDMARAGVDLSANQNATDRGVGLLGQLGNLEELRLAPMQRQLALGQMEDAMRQDQINADMAKFQEEQQAPWQQLGLYQSAVNPIAGMGGSSSGTQTTRGAQPSTAQTITGGVLSALGGLGKLGGASGIGSALGSLGSGIGSLGTSIASFLPMMFSDENAKEDIREVGKLHDGQKVYAYRYKGEPQTQIGLLAQEVSEHEPAAVGRHGGTGLLMVDYDKATARAAKKRAA